MSLSTVGSSFIDQDRENVLESAGQGVPLVDIASFCQYLLPKVPELPETAIRNIIDRVTRGPEYVDRSWTAFAQDPMHDRLREHESFKALVPVVSAIRKTATAVMPGLESTTEFVTAPEDPPVSTVLQNDERPDAYFVVKDPCRSSKTTSWLDIAITGEFNRGDTNNDTEDPNTKQALWNMHHMGREDARRRCLFAFTIENRTMRLWYADRSVIIASDSFDFMAEPGPFIRFVLAFSYAPLHNMGFDPTIVVDWDGDPLTKPQYIIEVQSRTEPGTVKTYKTVNALSASGAEAMRGGGTRVWTVRELVDGKMHGEELALKDCWIGLKGDVEGEIMEQLKKSPKAAKDMKELADMLLTVLNDGVVLLDDGSEVRTVHGDLRGRLVVNNPRTYRITCLYDPRLSIGSSDDSSVSDNPGDATEPDAPPLIYPAKKRYRIVFAEICQPLHEMQPVEARVCALARACWDLKLLHKLGWVHRNLNSGSILLLGETVKIADLKYAKKMDKKTSSESYEDRTDTRDYLSIEVVPSQKFAFLPSKEFVRRPTELAKRVLKRKFIAPTKEGSFIEPHTRSDIAPWFYNPLHDMESIEWITIDIFANRNPIFEYRKNSRGLKYKEEVVQQWQRVVKASNTSRQIFDRSNGNRHSLIRDNFALESILSSILHPVLVSMAPKIASMRDFLVEHYRKAEEKPWKIDRKCANGIHDYFTIILMEIADHIGAIGCDMRDEPLSEAVKKMAQHHSDMTYGSSKKRSRDIDDVDDATDDDHGDYPGSKLARTSVGKSPHGSPQTLTVLQSHILHDGAIVDRLTRRRNITTAPTPTRTLRSRVKKR